MAMSKKKLKILISTGIVALTFLSFLSFQAIYGMEGKEDQKEEDVNHSSALTAVDETTTHPNPEDIPIPVPALELRNDLDGLIQISREHHANASNHLDSLQELRHQMQELQIGVSTTGTKNERYYTNLQKDNHNNINREYEVLKTLLETARNDIEKSICNLHIEYLSAQCMDMEYQLMLLYQSQHLFSHIKGSIKRYITEYNHPLTDSRHIDLITGSARPGTYYYVDGTPRQKSQKIRELSVVYLALKTQMEIYMKLNGIQHARWEEFSIKSGGYFI